jgi:hypothetical protein
MSAMTSQTPGMRRRVVASVAASMFFPQDLLRSRNP